MITTIKEFRKINERLDIDVVPKDRDDLKQIIQDNMNEYGDNCNLNFIDVSNIKDMFSLFRETNFNGDISEWDVSNVENMQSMFYKSKFNQDISNWDVSKVTKTKYMFSYNKVFNQDLENWKLHKDCDTYNMFRVTKLAKDKILPSWYKP